MGGEISWECKGNGNYKFILKLYRECSGITFGTSEFLSVSNCPSVSIINMTLVSQTDISPVCNSSYPNIQCNPSPSSPNTGSVEEWLYTSDAVYPNGVVLSGVPPAQGWIFSHTSCCRNPCTNISGASNYGWFLRAVMYSYNGQNASSCFDNSPTFAERPATVICTGYPFTFTQNAMDKDNDSLSYEWAAPLDDTGTPLTPYFASGYSYNSPFPGPSVDINNVVAAVNSGTGEISFTSFTQGAFVTVIKVSSYKNGIKVAEVFREMQMVLLSCNANTIPVFSAPLLDTLYINNQILFVDTVYTNDTVSFPIYLYDSDTFPNGTSQTIILNAWGTEFGTNFIDPNSGCSNPPCATLDPPLPIIGNNSDTVRFRWITDCNHLESNQFNDFYFYFNYKDDFCPVPGMNNSVIKIVVKSDVEILKAPHVLCTQVLQNGNVILDWTKPIDTTGTFNSYHIFYSTQKNGPFVELDSIFDINQTSYTHSGAGGSMHPLYYYLKTRSGCGGKIFSYPSTHLASMNISLMDFSNGTVHLVWNPISSPLPGTSTGLYKIYRKLASGVWLYKGSVTDTNFYDINVPLNTTFNYRVDIEDSSGCVSSSQIISVNSEINSYIKNGNMDIQIIPNPFDENTEIVINSDKNTEIEIKISDNLGNLIKSENRKITNGKNSIPLSLKTFEKGIYLLQICNAGKCYNSRLVKY